jgi:N-methylhydantoinase B
MARQAWPVELDPITQEVIVEGLAATMAEMRANVMRAAYSAVVALLQDFSCGLFSPAGELIAQGPDHPGHIVPLPWGVRACMETFGSELAPGDVVVLNDPYRGGTHLNDVTVLLPVFLDGELFCFPAVRAHWADVGGTSPGSYSGEATNIFYEGIRIPPIKLYARGVLNEAAWSILMANVRLPEERRGDFLACVGACRTGERRILEMAERYGRAQVLAAVHASLDRAERRMRASIAALRDGVYQAEDYMEFFEAGRFDPGLIALRLEIAGEELVADFRRSSPQLPGVVNSTAAVTLAGVVIALKSALDPPGRINGGVFRPLRCLTNPSSIVNVAFDAPANAHGEVRKRTVSVMLAALAKVSPALVSGDLCGTSFPNVIGGWDPLRRKPFVYLAAPSGGNGGFAGADGPNALGNVDLGNLPTTYPSEEQESIFPLVVEEVGIRPDSEGPGAHRGGTGAVVRIRLLAEQADYSVTCDRAIIPPWGTLGGASAAPILNYIEDTRGGRTEFHLGKISSYPVRRDDRLTLQAAGGGGYGDPLEREPARVCEDVLDGYVSVERAAGTYGVIVRSDGTWDEALTRERRRQLRAARHHGVVVASEAPAYAGIRGSHRIQRLAPEWLGRLGVVEGDLIELIVPRAAPLRAWVRADPVQGPGLVPLDALGRALLEVEEGHRVELRVPACLNSANDLIVRATRVLARPGRAEGCGSATTGAPGPGPAPPAGREG